MGGGVGCEVGGMGRRRAESSGTLRRPHLQTPASLSQQLLEEEAAKRKAWIRNLVSDNGAPGRDVGD